MAFVHCTAETPVFVGLLWMPVGLLFFGLLATSEAFRPSRRGEFAPNPGSYDPNLIGGDIVLDIIPGSGASQNAFVKNKANLWPRGRVPYRTGLQKDKG